MTKRELIAGLAEARGMRPRAARAVLDAFLQVVERALTEGEVVTLRGFGRFEVRTRSGRRVRAPRGGREVQVPARLVPHFRGAPQLERRLAVSGPKRASSHRRV